MEFYNDSLVALRRAIGVPRPGSKQLFHAAFTNGVEDGAVLLLQQFVHVLLRKVGPVHPIGVGRRVFSETAAANENLGLKH